MKNIELLLVGMSSEPFAEFIEYIRRTDAFSLIHVNSTTAALQVVEQYSVDALVVAEAIEDGPGLQLVRSVVEFNPFVNCALVSSLSSKDFHQATEGLGIFMQLKPRPSCGEAQRLTGLLANLCKLTRPAI